ncbi:MAG: twin-arginine translocase TatA/TatE family subunit [Gammaproteobacteria bacterium]
MNISLSEIMLVLLIALLVIKPEQMPEVAQMLGRLIRSLRGVFAKVKTEVNGFIASTEKPDEHQQ